MNASSRSFAQKIEIVDPNADDPVSMNGLRPMEIYTVQQVASLLGITPRLACDMAWEGQIPARRLGRKWVVPRQSFEEWLRGLPEGA